jgi:threonyl-tRNA synthetase
MPPKRKASDGSLHNMRHSLAHVLAQAVLELYPETKIAIGPPVDTGCYYDFLFKKTISDADFPKIEKEMRRIIAEKQEFAVETLSVKDAVAFWKKKKQPFKVELVEDLKRGGEKKVTHFKNMKGGRETFVDLCQGGHVGNLGDIPSDGFTIASLAGAYWRGSEKREQLTRIYVAAFATKEELERFLTEQKLAKEHDHRKLGKELGIFIFSDVVGTGLPMLAPAGAVIRHELEAFIQEGLKVRGYSFAYTPNIGRTALYEKSGHLSHFRDHMYPVIEAEDGDYCLKPMNCPHHVEIYASEQRSYRDLPIRIAEFGTVYRYEKSGEVGGLTRVRCLTQDDAHHFMREDQMEDEIRGILDLSFHIYMTLGFKDFRLRLSLRGEKNKEKYIGTDKSWKLAEGALRKALQHLGLPFVEAEGEAAFYGPKIDLLVKDVFGREWQLGTIPQVDYNMPERFNLSYVNEEGKKVRPVMMHRAIIGSFERFIGILIEQFGGLFPLWLSPVQVLILPVAAAHQSYANRIFEDLRKRGVRAKMGSPAESLGKRIREGEMSRIPIIVVVGDQEEKLKAVNVRSVRKKKQQSFPLEEFLMDVEEDIRKRKLEESFF